MKVFLPRESESDPFVLALRSARHQVFHAPLTKTIVLDNAVKKVTQQLVNADWIIISSAKTVRFLSPIWQFLAKSIKIVAVGPATQKALKDYGVAVSFRPVVASASGILNELSTLVKPREKILIPGSAISRTELAQKLRVMGTNVIQIPIYDTQPVTTAPPELINNWDNFEVIVLLASSQAEALSRWAPNRQPLILALGKPTADTCNNLKWPVVFVANEPTPEGVVHKLDRLEL